MKKNIIPFIAIIFICSLLISCENSGGDSSSISNFNQDTDTLEEPATGPENTNTVEPNIETYQESTENNADTPLIQCNISDGQTGVEVNLPITIVFDKEIDEDTVTPATFYLKDSSDNVQYFRIIKDNNEFTLIPQIRLQPGRQYTVVIAGIKDTTGNTLNDTVITFTNNELDFGLYFFGRFGLCEKYFPGIENSFYDPSKPTSIFAHGWQNNAASQTDAYGREGYNHEIFFWSEDNFKGKKKHNGLRQWTNHAWIDQGWNTAIVYWTQFADDGLMESEGKIWSFNGPGGSRYRILNENGQLEQRTWNRQFEFDGQTVTVNSVSEMLGLYVIHALQQNSSGNIRFIGHSLGNQLATNLAHQCFENNITVERIALLDPAWSGGGKDYLGDSNYDSDNDNDWTGERCRYFLFEMMNDWNNNLAIEIYHTTGMNLGIPVVDDNSPLTSIACDVNNSPWYYSATQLAEKHVSIRHSYFWSLASSAPPECTINWWRRILTGEMGPSASTPTWRILEMMNEQYEWTQVEGRYTPDPSDDWFERKKKERGLFGSIL